MDMYNQGITKDERNLLYGIFKELNQRVDCAPESNDAHRPPQQTQKRGISVIEGAVNIGTP